MRRPRSSVTEPFASTPTSNMTREIFDEQAADYEQAVNRSISFTGRNASFFAERKVGLLSRLLRSRDRISAK